MKGYDRLQSDKKAIEKAILKQKKLDHKLFVKENRKSFLFLDILVISMILMNFGAVAITNLLVMRKAQIDKVEMEFVEMNPVQAEVNDWVEPPQEQRYSKAAWILKSLSFNALVWTILMFIYTWYRRNCTNEEGLVILLVVLLTMFVSVGTDFSNDLGFYLGWIWYR